MSSLWKIPDPSKIETPVSFLRQQADELSELTRGVLLGNVEVVNSGNNIALSLRIIVPALNHYSFYVCTYQQPITMFPGFLEFPSGPNSWRVNDIEEFKNKIGEILSSDAMGRIIGGLLAQANAT